MRLPTVAAAARAAAALSACGSTSASVDGTQVGGSFGSQQMHTVFGHLFEGVSTVHVDYKADGGASLGSADVIIGPPTQATITATSATDPRQTASIVIKGGKTYLTQASLKGTWLLMATGDDGVSATPAFGQTIFEHQYLGPNSSATFVGPETVNGTSTRKYDFSAPVDSTGTVVPSGTAGARATVYLTVWIDGSGRLIQYRYSPTGDGHFVVATYSKWGESVTVNAPPAKDVKVVEGAM